MLMNFFIFKLISLTINNSKKNEPQKILTNPNILKI